jgi:DNA repair protein RadA/Sms
LQFFISNEDIPHRRHLFFAAEVGLAGRSETCTAGRQRILETEKLGYHTIIVSKSNEIGLKKKQK